LLLLAQASRKALGEKTKVAPVRIICSKEPGLGQLFDRGVGGLTTYLLSSEIDAEYKSRNMKLEVDPE